MKLIDITAFLRLKANGKGKPKRFVIKAYSGGLLPVDGFPHPVVVDLSGLEMPGSIPILIDHEKSVEATLGATDNIVNDGRQLMLEGVVTGQSGKAQQVLAQAAAGHTWQASIGAMVIESEDVPAGQTATANGQTFTGPVVIARRAVLRETSVLPMGADSTTSVNLAASARRFLKGSAAMSFEDYCKSLGLDASTLTPEAAAALQTSFAAMNAPAPVAAAPAVPAVAPVAAPTAAAGAALDLQASLAEGRKMIAAQFRKSAEIQAKAAGHPEIIATAIDQDWSIDKVELEVMKKRDIQARTRPTSFTASQDAIKDTPIVLEAAVCLARKHSDAEKRYDDKTLQAAHAEFKRGIGLQELMIRAAAGNGLYVQAGQRVHDGNLREILEYACPRPKELKAGFATVSLPGILSNVANKEILEGYMEEDSVWKEVFETKSVSDFKTVTSYRMLDAFGFEKLGPGGKIKYGKVSEESFTRSVDTYAKMFKLNRRDIINDDMSAFDALRRNIGMGSAEALNDLIWQTFLSNLATIFTTARTNYISGATTNLGTDGVGLGLGQKAWRQRTSPPLAGQTVGKRLGGQARFVLVPSELETIADALYATRNINAVKVSDSNTFFNKYQPIVATQLSDSTFTGYSTTAWYMLGDKSRGTPVTVSFLNGQQTPTVESADADFDELGVVFRGYHDFGADLGDGYMNALMSKGAA